MHNLLVQLCSLQNLKYTKYSCVSQAFICAKISMHPVKNKFSEMPGKCCTEGLLCGIILDNRFGKINCCLASQAHRLLLGEAVTKIGSSEPILVTDEGDITVFMMLLQVFSVLHDFPHPALRATFPQGKAL